MTALVALTGGQLRPTAPRAFTALLYREMRVLRRNLPGTAARIVLQPLLFTFVFAYVLPKIGGAAFETPGQRLTFATILVPGLIGSSMITQGTTAVIFPLLMELSWQRSIEDRALAPVSTHLLALEKIVAGAVQALLAGVVVFPAVLLVHASGEEPRIHVADWPLLIVVVIFAALLAAAGGLLVGTLIDSRQVSQLFTLILLPATMLGCVYYPWSALAHLRWLQVAVLLNPMVYASEGLRAALTPQVGHMPAWAFLLALIGGAGLLTILAMRSFTRRVIG
jgi:ABC-type polysaccharide/polyol phosphate export permease